MATPIIVTGDDLLLVVPLLKNDQPFVINGTATVKARFVSSNHLTVLSAEVAQVSGTAGAYWAGSVVAVAMPAAITEGITQQGVAALEIQVDDGIKLTWFAEVSIVRGSIA